MRCLHAPRIRDLATAPPDPPPPLAALCEPITCHYEPLPAMIPIGTRLLSWNALWVQRGKREVVSAPTVNRLGR